GAFGPGMPPGSDLALARRVLKEIATGGDANGQAARVGISGRADRRLDGGRRLHGVVPRRATGEGDASGRERAGDCGRRRSEVLTTAQVSWARSARSHTGSGGPGARKVSSSALPVCF